MRKSKNIMNDTCLHIFDETIRLNITRQKTKEVHDIYVEVEFNPLNSKMLHASGLVPTR